MIDRPVAVFATFGIVSQALLVAFFVSMRWFPQLARRYGWIAYAVAACGLAVGGGLAVAGAPWQLFVGPIVFAAWAGYGAWVDLVRRIEWRPAAESVLKQPIRWNVLGPYITLYLAAQMFLWWPLWDYWRPGWAVYLVLFVANTGLNIAGHFGTAPRSSAHPA